MNETQTILRKILDFLIGFLGSLILGNIGIVLLAQFDTPERLWISCFTWFWHLALAGLAVFFFTKKGFGFQLALWLPSLCKRLGYSLLSKINIWKLYCC